MEALILIAAALLVGLLAGGLLLGARLLGERAVRRELAGSFEAAVERERSRHFLDPRPTPRPIPRGWVT